MMGLSDIRTSPDLSHGPSGRSMDNFPDDLAGVVLLSDVHMYSQPLISGPVVVKPRVAR